MNLFDFLLELVLLLYPLSLPLVKCLHIFSSYFHIPAYKKLLGTIWVVFLWPSRAILK